MRILVCIKRVPELDTLSIPEQPSQSFNDIDLERTSWRMNRYDEYALELALQLKDRIPDCRIDALTVGDEDAGEALRRAIGMGADHGIHIRQSAGVFASPFALSGLIAGYAREKTYDLILCGVMAEDAMQGLVGPILAGLLDWPCLTAVQAMTWKSGSREVVCEREIDGGRREVVAVELPALLTIQSSALQPRYPALSKLLRANHYPLEIINAGGAPSIRERQRVDTLKPPMRTREGTKLEGSPDDKARQLATLLRAKGFC
jgi:electron transfer flavoprotein beta subunit